MIKPKPIRLKEYQNYNVKKTFDINFIPKLILEAVKNEWDFLDNLNWNNLRVLDIGVGEGRHPTKYAPMCKKFVCVDISEDMIKMTQEKINEKNIKNVELILSDAEHMDGIEDNSIDRVMCMYFTAGNFRRDNFDVKNYDPTEMEKNPKFINILKKMYKALNKGSIYLTVYKDTKQAQDNQYAFYDQTSQHIISNRSDSFTATQEGFWSLRFSKERMLSNLSHAEIKSNQVIFHDLNEISWIVEIKK